MNMIELNQSIYSSGQSTYLGRDQRILQNERAWPNHKSRGYSTTSETYAMANLVAQNQSFFYIELVKIDGNSGDVSEPESNHI
ncbi:hypothetical protein AYI69_g10728 [Smittium culicis]|uniref:Uncharacterized protein n=1 Tax=Smittium culicis TaxID=133412 RepID=A0A1R1X3Y7_9FUNG|nr:hypothetical protein AYI69_g10728 [Smittium culicis]